MKKFNPTSSAWNRFRAKKNKQLRVFGTLILMLCATAILGAVLQPETGAGAGVTAVAAGMVAIPFLKKNGGMDRLYNTEGGGGGGGKLSAEAEKSILDKVKEVVNEAIEKKAKEPGASDDDIKKFKEFYNVLDGAKTMKDIVDMQKNLEELGLQLKSSQEQAQTKKKGFFAALQDEWTKNKETIQKMADGDKETKSVVLDVKAAIVMGEDNTIGSGTTQHSLTTFTGIISTIRLRVLTYLANVSVGTTTNKIVYWIEETDPQGTPIFIGEGDAKTQLSIKYVEKTATVKKIGVYGKVTTEMLADLGQLIAYIQNNLMKRMDIVTEDQLLDGNGAGDNLQGVIPLATAFAAPASLALSVQDANEYDVIEAVALQSKIAFGMPNVIFVHPATKSKMKLLKDSQGAYIYPRWASEDAMTVAGMRVVDTQAITEGEFVGGDFTVVNVLIRENATIQIGLDGNDFTNNIKTMLMEQRLVQFVSANDTQVLVKGTFAAAITALNDPS